MDERTWLNRCEKLLEVANKRHENKIRLVPKHEKKWLWWPLSVLFKAITFGKGPWLLDSFYTTIGRTIYLPGDGSQWDAMKPEDRYALLRHEISHMDCQFFGEPDLQATWEQGCEACSPLKKSIFWRFLYAFLYLFFPLPCKYSFFRQEVEYWGYIQQLRMVLLLEGKVSEGVMAWLESCFTGSAYGWMATSSRGKELVGKMVSQVVEEQARGVLEARLLGPTIPLN